jgi:hypothetical protein
VDLKRAASNIKSAYAAAVETAFVVPESDFQSGRVVTPKTNDTSSHMLPGNSETSESLCSRGLESVSAQLTLQESSVLPVIALTKSQKRNMQRKSAKLRKAAAGILGMPGSTVGSQAEPQRSQLETAVEFLDSSLSYLASSGLAETPLVFSAPSDTTAVSINNQPNARSLTVQPEQPPFVAPVSSSGKGQFAPTPYEKITFMATGLHRVEAFRPGQKESWDEWQRRAIFFQPRFEMEYARRIAEVAASKQNRRFENALLNRNGGL